MIFPTYIYLYLGYLGSTMIHSNKYGLHRVSCDEIRNWSLITERGGVGYETGEGVGWVCEVLNLKKGVAEQVNVLAMLKGGTNCFGVVFTWELEVLAFYTGGTKSVYSLKGLSRKVLPCFEGGPRYFGTAVLSD